MIDVSIDSREPDAPFFVSKIIEAGYIPKIEMLNVSDFIVYGKAKEEDSTIIERKTASDFLGSLEGKKDENGIWEKGRLWDQLKRMKESGVKDKRLVIEGSITSKLTVFRKKGFTRERIWGAKHGISNWGVHIENLKNKDETAEYLIYLIKQKEKPKAEFSLRASPNKSMSLKERKLYLLQGLPNIGPKTSKLILDHYGSIVNFINKIDTIDKVIPRIGIKAKKEIKEVLEN